MKRSVIVKDPTAGAQSIQKTGRTDLILMFALLGFAAIIQFVGADEPTASATLTNIDKRIPNDRNPRSPTDISGKGWKNVLWRTYEQTGEDRLLAVAAGVVFYGLLALFPAITALVSSYALLLRTPAR
jgi:hypothetical protein